MPHAELARPTATPSDFLSAGKETGLIAQADCERTGTGSSTAPYLSFDRFDVLTIAAVLVLYAAVALLPFKPNKYGDLDFHLGAKSFAAAVRGKGAWKDVGIFRAPVPVLYYGVPYLVLPAQSPDASYAVVAILWNMLWTCIAALLIRRTAVMLAGDFAGFLSILLMLTTPFWAYYTFGVNGEAPAFVSVAFFSYAWSRWLSAERHVTRFQYAALTCACLAAFLLTKPGATSVLGLAVLAGATLWRAAPACKRRVARISLVCAASVMCCVIASSLLLNFLARNRPRTPQVQYLSWTAFFGSFQFRNEPWDWRFWDHSTRAGSADYQAFTQQYAALNAESIRRRVPLSDLEWVWIKDDIAQHPWLRLRMVAVRLLTLHVPAVNSVAPAKFRLGPLNGIFAYVLFHAAVAVSYGALMVGAIWFLIQRRSHIPAFWIFWGPWVTLAVFHSLIYAEPRFLSPAQPGLIIMSAVAFREYLMRAALSKTALPAPR